MLFDVATEQVAVDRAVDDQRRDESARSQARQEGRRLPVRMRNVTDQPCAERGSTAGPRQVRLDPRFVEKDESLGIEARLSCAPRCATLGHVRPKLLGGVQYFF